MDGKYEIIRKIGAGGNGVVYQVYDHRLDRHAAIKKMSVHNEMSHAELELLKQLRHPALPVVLDFFRQGENAYLVMEYIEGITLTQYRKCLSEPDQEKAAGIILQLCDVLSYLHESREPVIHRDIKPDNILLDLEGKVHLIDFGAALFLHREKGKSTAGTDGYAAPEQLLREEAAYVDEKADIYGIGATFYYLLTGTVPAGRGRENPGIRTYSRTLSGTLEQIIRKATENEKRRRYESVGQMKEELNRFHNQDRRKKSVSAFLNCFYHLLILAGGILFYAYYSLAERSGGTQYQGEVLGAAAGLTAFIFIKEGIFSLHRSRICRRVKDICLNEKGGISLFIFFLSITAGILLSQPIFAGASAAAEAGTQMRTEAGTQMRTEAGTQMRTEAGTQTVTQMRTQTETQTSNESRLAVTVKEKGYNILVRYDAVYEMEKHLLLEIDKDNFIPGKVYQLELICREEAGNEVMQRKIYLKVKEP